jgi:DNA gyrase subunit A
MQEGERIAALLTVREFEDDKFIVMGTKLGEVKKTELSAFSNPRAGGIIAMDVEEGDSVIAVQVSEAATRSSSARATACRSASARATFARWGVPPGGSARHRAARRRSGRGDGSAARPGGTILSVNRAGLRQAHGARGVSPPDRAARVGIINIQTSDRNGKVIGVAQVT